MIIHKELHIYVFSSMILCCNNTLDYNITRINKFQCINGIKKRNKNIKVHTVNKKLDVIKGFHF